MGRLVAGNFHIDDGCEAARPAPRKLAGVMDPAGSGVELFPEALWCSLGV